MITKDNHRVLRSLILMCMVGMLLIAPTAQASPTMKITLEATQDTYVDLNFATINFDQGLLTAANSPGPPMENDITTKRIFIQFDLSNVDFEIKYAQLSLASLTCGGKTPVDVVDLAVYGVENDSGWDEAALTWENQPAISTGVLAALDAGSTVFNSNSYYTWTDDQQGDLATWLESQRGMNDKSATLVLEIANSDNPGLADIFFEDREGSGETYGCPNVFGSPSLQISDHLFELYLPFVDR